MRATERLRQYPARVLALSAAWAFGLLGQSCGLGETISLGKSTDAGGDSSGGTDGEGAHGGEGGLTVDDTPQLQATEVWPVVELADPDKDDNPTLTSDELELCLTSTRAGGQGGSDVWCALRNSKTDPFGPLEPLTLINEDGFDSSAALALDGLSLWVGTQKEDTLGGLDIFVSVRSGRDQGWGEPQRVVELSSEEDDIPRPCALGDTVMPLGSRRGGDGYQTYLAERSSTEETFDIPRPIAELKMEGVEIVDGFLTEDGLTLLYSLIDVASEDPSDIYYSHRTTLDDAFSAPRSIRGVNSSGDDRDPWLSLDGSRLYFSSDRSGDFEIWMAEITGLSL